jgi:hypothetical protein
MLDSKNKLLDMVRAARLALRETRKATFALQARNISSTGKFLLEAFVPHTPFVEGQFQVSLTALAGEPPTLFYTLCDVNTAEVEYGSFELSVTPICYEGEIELLTMSYDDWTEEPRMIRAIQHVIVALGAERVIYTSVDYRDGARIENPMEWMSYYDTRPTNAEGTFSNHVHVWETDLP